MAQVFASRGPPCFFCCRNISSSCTWSISFNSNWPHQMLGLQACLLPHENFNSKQARDKCWENSSIATSELCKTPNDLSSSCDRAVKKATALAHHAYLCGNWKTLLNCLWIHIGKIIHIRWQKPSIIGCLQYKRFLLSISYSNRFLEINFEHYLKVTDALQQVLLHQTSLLT